MFRILAFSIIILLYGLLTYWIGLRMWQLVGRFIPYLPIALFWLMFWLIAFSFFAGHLSKKYLAPGISRWLILLGDYWLAFMFYCLIVLAILELFLLAGQRLAFLPRGSYDQFPAALVLGLGVLLTVLVIFSYGWWNARHPQVTHYDISIPKSAGQLKQLHVVAVSDLHLGIIVDNYRLAELVAMVNDLKPDIILLPGDIVDGDPLPYIEQNMAETWRRLKSRYGIYAVLGNHEYIGGQSATIINRLEQTGIKVLRDAVVLVEGSFYLVGREDVYSSFFNGNERKTLASIMAGIDRDPKKPAIVLDHQPVHLDEPWEQEVDLQISGHTHRGQLAPLSLITEHIFEVDYGYLCKGQLQIIVSSGFGTWGPPIRVGNRPEILDILIKFTSLDGD
ncbi:putative metallophosphoesterase [Sporotomaculum syntrophicum]|uniref:Metallophosphoesterase n=1 Tax=Sporotomaculum syntrophicum TaxID=182264 RepID=A0A9D3B066_9FIRM|nr:metallophosphoesterase [Sporotomaculum syntrophicum]KAF1086623.1 putative metallophosphoesterase [Sporotomaculum syntrophicum]